MTKKIFFTISLLLFTPVWASNRCDELVSHPEDPQNPAGVMGVSFYDIDYEPALKACQQALEKAPDNPRYQYLLGRLSDVKEDYTASLKWYYKASAGGYASAQKRIGDMYYHGEGVEASNEKAVEWYIKAAEKGHATAQFNLGIFYEDGMGVEKSAKEAAKWYEKAAEQGDSDAQFNLGYSYYYGEGVPQSYEKAEKWYRQAAEQGDADAQYQLGRLYFDEDRYKISREWFRQAIEQGSTNAYLSIGLTYEYENDTVQNKKMAYAWYSLAVEKSEDGIYALRRIEKTMKPEEIAEAKKIDPLTAEQ